MRKFLFAAATTLLALPTYADNLKGFYAGAGLDFIDGNTTDAAGNNVDFRAVEFHGGYKHNSWLGGELRVGLGLSGENFAVSNGTDVFDVDVSIDHFETLYYRAESTNAVAKLYGLLGYTNIQTSSKLGDASVSASESGPSYGFGVGFVMNEDANLNFEYRQIINKDSAEFTALTVSFDYRF